jgi:hypothetical protein
MATLLLLLPLLQLLLLLVLLLLLLFDDDDGCGGLGARLGCEPGTNRWMWSGTGGGGRVCRRMDRHRRQMQETDKRVPRFKAIGGNGGGLEIKRLQTWNLQRTREILPTRGVE